jgi:hypothetical protein
MHIHDYHDFQLDQKDEDVGGCEDVDEIGMRMADRKGMRMRMADRKGMRMSIADRKGMRMRMADRKGMGMRMADKETSTNSLCCWGLDVLAVTGSMVI